MKRMKLANKYLLIVTMLLVMLVLSGCRTRITNNNEVSNVQYDEGGYLQDNYQMRRDELGLSTAKKPILPDLGGEDFEDEDYDNLDDTEFNYTPDEEVPYTDTTTTTTTPTSPGTTSGGGGRRVGTPTSPGTTTKIVITFDPNGGTITEGSQTLILTKGSKIGTMPSAKRDGYKWDGKWYTDKTGGRAVKATEVVDKGMWLYAHWEEEKEKPKPEEKVKVTFYGNEGSPEAQTEIFKKGAALSFKKIKTPTRDDFEFLGWYTSATGGKKVKAGTPVEGKLDLYAQWKEAGPKEYTISFDVNGGEDGFDDIPVKDGVYHLPEGKPIREGYKFQGWYTKKDGGDKISGGEALTDSVTLYAHWKSDEDYWGEKLSEKVSEKVGSNKKKILVLGAKKDANWLKKAGIDPSGTDSENDGVLVFSEYSESIPEGSIRVLQDAEKADDKEQLAYCIAIADKLGYTIEHIEDAYKDLMGEGNTPVVE